MANVPRPLLGLLVATVAFFALWIVALKPSSNANGTGSALGVYQPAVNQAKASVASQNAAAAAANATSVSGTAAPTGASPSATSTPAANASTANSTANSTAKSAPKSAPKSAATTGHHARVRVTPATTTKTAPRATSVGTATPTQRLDAVERALDAHKVLALLVYNPAAADDQAVKQELGAIPRSGGRVVKLAIPVGEVTHYPVVTSQLQITSSPTLVIVDADAQAFSLVGFVDKFEIAQRIGDALRVR